MYIITCWELGVCELVCAPGMRGGRRGRCDVVLPCSLLTFHPRNRREQVWARSSREIQSIVATACQHLKSSISLRHMYEGFSMQDFAAPQKIPPMYRDEGIDGHLDLPTSELGRRLRCL